MSRRSLALFLAGALTVPLVAQADFNRALDQAALDYAERLRLAGAELAATRERIAQEKAPLLQAQRTAEDRLLAAESDLTRQETAAEQAGANRQRLVKAAAALHKNTAYLGTLAQESLKGYADSLAPGEDRLHADPLRELETAFHDPDRSGGGRAAVDVAEFLLARVQQSLGGYTAPGQAMIDGGNEVKTGTFAYVGPQAFFQAGPGGEAGVVVRLREGASHPVTFPVDGWQGAGPAALFQGGAGTIAADATGGKALRLKQTTGTLWEHVEKGGDVAYAILAVGLLALLIFAQKLHDLTRLAVDEGPAAQAFLAKVAQGGRAAAEPALPALRATTRELFATGLRHMDRSKLVLEEHLQALLLKQRLHFERRLPLLAVIATAAPLMGLLGTVVGMVKTFALITVFGTGNAGKLASGISEVLVATELGLAVAIPALVAHGFLSQRIHRNLATLERYALEFVTAAKSGEETPAAR